MTTVEVSVFDVDRLAWGVLVNEPGLRIKAWRWDPDVGTAFAEVGVWVLYSAEFNGKCAHLSAWGPTKWVPLADPVRLIADVPPPPVIECFCDGETLVAP